MQFLIHGLRSQRQDHCRHQVPREDGGRQRRGRVDAVRVGQVVGERHEGQVDADAEEDAGEGGHGGRDVRRRRPAQPELRDGVEGPAGAGERETPVFGA